MYWIKSITTKWFNKNTLEAKVEIKQDFLTSNMNYSIYGDIGREIVLHISQEIAPIIKDKLLESEEFKKLLSEVRLEIVKQIIK